MKKGFTLIELLVVIAISGILIRVGIVNYGRYNRKVQVRQSAQNLVSVLRSAQNRATTGNKPSGCTGGLIGYTIDKIDSTSYTVTANCETGNVNQSYKLTSLTSFQSFSPLSFTFDPLYGSVDQDVSIVITHTRSTDTASVKISVGGGISCVNCK